MALKEILTEINDDVKDIVTMSFELTQTQSDYVPNDEDPGLTFESGKAKKAKLIEACVLYADMRNSTPLSKTHSKEVMARLYSAFIGGAIYAAHYHNGIIRNIVGDRIMVVFPKRYCFTNAVDTAISINTIASKIINRHFKGLDFKVGIGIDFGEMKVIKAGVAKQGKERASNKNLVWIGNPANIASKLTDVANKEIIRPVYRVTRNPINPKAFRPIPSRNPLDVLRNMGKMERVPNEPYYLGGTETVDLSPEEFAECINPNIKDGIISTLGGKVLKFEKAEVKTQEQPILMTQSVWQGFREANPTRNSVVNKNWTQQSIKVKEYSGQIFGGDMHWSVVNEIPS